MNIQTFTNREDISLNQCHRGHVEYKLPVMIITKILELTWMISTYDQEFPLLSYKKALKLTLINKRFFGIVSKRFNNIKLLSHANSSMMDELHDRLTNVWCPIKHIFKLQVGIPVFEELMKQPSPHLTHMLSTVEKLHIHRETNCGPLTENSIKTFGTIDTNLHSLIINSILLDFAHLDAICSIKSLRKIDISTTFMRISDILAVLCNNLPLLESIKLICFSITAIPIASRSRIRKLSSVYLDDTDETFEFPNLQRMINAYQNGRSYIEIPRVLPGLGPRNCVGMNLANDDIAISNIVSNFIVSSHDGKPIDDT
ncbi:hypothetical protein PPL_03408 [Heterostelium album PN500]|uniref:Uncharacterized protein n=1 Tax=Heterostelium pallidum (strain ATCC 26659 / Pp 5 / PN500) TaxID=670386 RepID=D3B4T2_HETP5|nr:hypothetical protein PPL_03408 [Heterostelium album PN500]EFA84330.1 hypothetical protein PPL_03408 [Heterostelium album PN500]|eukprot:XP_020436445.1 hypothetical protein PPL_03408 [Heterostelium album PN500]